MMKPTLSIAAVALGLAFTATGSADTYAPAQHANWASVEDAGRAGRFLVGTDKGILPGDVVDLYDSDDKLLNLSFQIYKVYNNESYGRLQGSLTQDRLDAVKNARTASAYGRFSRQPSNRTKCTNQLPTPIRESDKLAVLGGKAPSGYVVVPLDLKNAVNNGTRFPSVAAGSSKLVLPKAKAYVVWQTGQVFATEVSSVQQNDSTIDIDKIDLKANTMALAFASQARVAIAVGTCN